MKTIVTNSWQETRDLGSRLARALRPGAILCLFGDLGSGKTTLVKGLAEGLGIRPDRVSSPTFVLMNAYEQGRIPLYHFDFYRLEHPDEIAGIGYDEFLYGEGIAVVEWSERFGPHLPAAYLRVELTFVDEHQRRVEMSAVGGDYDRVLSRLARPTAKRGGRS